MQTFELDTDPHAQLRALYQSLLNQEDHFHEFKQLLGLYGWNSPDGGESVDDEAVRERLNARIRQWIGGFDGLNAMQAMLWRNIVVESRINVALSPWKEANWY
jgi:hypothetical protein